MPDSIFGLDAGFPQFTGSESLKQKTDMMYDYMVQLQESLRYTMQNLDASNFNPTGLKRIQEPVMAQITDLKDNTALLWLTAEELATELTAADGRISAVSQTVEGITLSVSNGEKTSSIKLVVGDKEIEQQIQMTGLVTMTDLAGEGTTEINGANIKTGKVSAIEIDSCQWTSTGDDGCSVKIVGNAVSFLLKVGTGNITAAQMYMTNIGTFRFDTLSGYEMHQSSSGKMKLTAKANMSLDAEGSIYIGASEGYTTPVHIGSGRSEIRLYGNVYVNDVLIS